MNIEYHRFIDTMNKIHKIDSGVLRKIYTQFSCMHIEKNQHFIMEGSTSNTVAIVAEGLFKSSFINEKGDEYIKYFLTTNDILLGNLKYNNASRVSIQAIQNSIIFSIDYMLFDAMCEKYHSLREMKSTLLTRYLERKEERERQLLSNDAKRNYELFIRQYPQLHGNLSQNYIAMYLGITPTQLSRIKKHFFQHM